MKEKRDKLPPARSIRKLVSSSYQNSRGGAKPRERKGRGSVRGGAMFQEKRIINHVAFIRGRC